MSAQKWKASEELLRLFQAVGRASLLYDIQDSHSGNMAVRWTDERGDEQIVITATGSQKGRPRAEPDLLPLADRDGLRVLQGVFGDGHPRPDPGPARACGPRCTPTPKS